MTMITTTSESEKTFDFRRCSLMCSDNRTLDFTRVALEVVLQLPCCQQHQLADGKRLPSLICPIGNYWGEIKALKLAFEPFAHLKPLSLGMSLDPWVSWYRWGGNNENNEFVRTLSKRYFESSAYNNIITSTKQDVRVSWMIQTKLWV